MLPVILVLAAAVVDKLSPVENSQAVTSSEFIPNTAITTQTIFNRVRCMY
ncbi:MAG: hypothetical protein LBU65_04990 [Planctomycetaceae bacterium]|nr:hypothetical protein [Planctomycetaceae bacterium]